jgi:hypothetical protein
MNKTNHHAKLTEEQYKITENILEDKTFKNCLHFIYE